MTGMKTLRKFIREALEADKDFKARVIEQLRLLGIDEFKFRFHFPSAASSEEYEEMSVYLDHVMETQDWMNPSIDDISEDFHDFVLEVILGDIKEEEDEIVSPVIIPINYLDDNEQIKHRGEAVAKIESKGWKTMDDGYMLLAYHPKHWRIETHGDMEKMSDREIIYSVEGGGLGYDDTWLYAISKKSRAAVRDALMIYMFASAHTGDLSYYDSVHEYAQALRRGSDYTLGWEPDGQGTSQVMVPADTHLSYHLGMSNINTILGDEDEDWVDIGQQLLDISVE